LQEVFRETFDDDSVVLSNGTTAKEIDGWDSTANVRLMVAIEEAFHITFDISEFNELRNVGALLRLIDELEGAKA
jgi:acyl carrier protein